MAPGRHRRVSQSVLNAMPTLTARSLPTVSQPEPTTMTTSSPTSLPMHTPVATGTNTFTPIDTVVGTPSPPNSSIVAPTKGRGRSRGKEYKKYRKHGGQKPRITFLPGKMRPVGPSSKMFRAHVGVLCREHAPITCVSWSHMDPADKANIYYHITDKYEIDMNATNVRIGLDKWLAKAFRTHKFHMHKHFKSFGNNVEEARRHPYDNVRVEDWQVICDNFMDPTFKERSRINIGNRSKNLTNHCGGSKPFVTIRYEMRDPEIQEEPDIVTFYEHTHCRKNGTWVTPQSEKLHRDMIQLLESQPSDEASPLGSTHSIRNQVFHDIVGHRSGYVNGLGHGEMPPASSRCSQADIIEARQRSTQLEEQLREQSQNHQVEMEDQRGLITSLQSQITNLSSMVQQLLGAQNSSMGATRPT